MAKVYYDKNLTRLAPPAMGVLPLDPIRDKLQDVRTQRLIPFLGAGASLQARLSGQLAPPAKRPDRDTVDKLCAALDVTDPVAKRFVEISLQFAQLLQQRSTLVEKEEEQYAPTSWQLASRLAEVLTLRPLDPLGSKLKTLLAEPADRGDYVDVVAGVADVMGLSHSVPQLLTVASYFNEDQQRGILRNKLLSRLLPVTCVTKTQNMVAQRAASFIQAQMSANTPRKLDYLIITTNYDQLIERRLQELHVPTVVVTVNAECEVVTQPVPDCDTLRTMLNLPDRDWQDLCHAYGVKQPNSAPGAGATQHTRVSALKFAEPTDKKYSMAVVYKIHGCPVIYNALRAEQAHHDELPDHAADDEHAPIDWDSIVISDQDYVRFIQMNHKNIPTYVTNRARQGGLMFLGYSFSDWNVRALYQRFVNSRYANEEARSRSPNELRNRDYVVVRSFDETDAYFFNPWDVSVLVTDLNVLVDALA